MPRPFHVEGAGQWTVTPSEGVRRGTGRNLGMLESLLALGGLVLLRGEGRRGFGTRLKRRKWRGGAIGHKPGVEVWTTSWIRKPQCS